LLNQFSYLLGALHLELRSARIFVQFAEIGAQSKSAVAFAHAKNTRLEVAEGKTPTYPIPMNLHLTTVVLIDRRL